MYKELIYQTNFFITSQSTAVATQSKISALLLTSVYIHVLRDQWSIITYYIPLTQLRSHTIRLDIYHDTFIVHTYYIRQYGLEWE